MNETPCKGCGRTIVWGITKEGIKIPLDPKPPVYEFEDVEPGDHHLVARNKLAMVSHFATCPKASQFSGSKKP